MPGKDPEVLYHHDGLELVRHFDGRRELRIVGHMMDSLEAAFDAIVAWYWDNADQTVRVTLER
jgi:hypothetical protein